MDANQTLHSTHEQLLDEAAAAFGKRKPKPAPAAPKKAEPTYAEKVKDQATQMVSSPTAKEILSVPTAAVKGAVGGVQAVAEHVQSGSKQIADAIVPPKPDASAGERVGNLASGLGDYVMAALHSAMTASGVSSGGAVGKTLIEHVMGEDSKAPLPEAVRNVYMAAQTLFNIPPQMLSSKERAEWQKDPHAYAAKHLKQNAEPTWGDLGEFIGSMAIPHAVAKMGGEAKPGAPKPEAPPAAPKPGSPAARRAADRAAYEAKLAPKTEAVPQGNENFTGAPATPEGVKYRATAEGWEPETPKAPEAAAEGQQSGGSPPANYSDAMHAEYLKNKETGFAGATYDPRTGAAPTDYGTKFVASNTEGGAMKTPVAEFTPQHITDFAAQHAAELAQENAHHGIWEDNGTVYQDVSRRVPTREEALQIARNAPEKQLAIWDEANNSAIDVTPEEPMAPAEVPAPEPTGDAGAAEVPAPEPLAETPPVEAQPAAPRTRGATAAMAAAEGSGRMLPEVDPELARAASPYTEVGGNELKPGMEKAGVDLQGEQPAEVPQVQTFQDAAQAIEPQIAEGAYGPPTAADYLRIRDEGVQKVQAARTENPKLSRRSQQDMMRQHLNDNGILSQSQSKAITERAIANGETEPIPTPTAENAQPEHINGDALREAVAELRKRADVLHETLNKLLGTGGESTLGGGIPIRVDLTQLRATGEAGVKFMNQAANVGAAILVQLGEKGKRTLKAFSERVKAELGDLLGDDVMKDLFEKSKAALSKLQEASPNLLTFEGARRAWEAGKNAMYWYGRAPEVLAEQYVPLAKRVGNEQWKNATPEQIVNMAAEAYAATSIGTRADTVNIDLAHRAIEMILSGERNGNSLPFTLEDGVSAGKSRNDHINQLNRVAQGLGVQGPKIGPYAETLKGKTSGTDAQGTPVFDPVIDSWMGEGYGMVKRDVNEATGKVTKKQWAPNKAEREYIVKTITDIANSEGVKPQEVQAAQWVTFKSEADIAKLKKTKRWADMDEIDRQNEVERIWKNNSRSFDELLTQRLAPSIKAGVKLGDTSPGARDRYLSGAVMKALAEPDALLDPSGKATTALMEQGVDGQTAQGTVAKIWDGVKQHLNSVDPEGAKFSKVGMGIDPYDVWRMFHKDDALPKTPYDPTEGRVALDAVKEALDTDVDEALRADLRKTVTDEQAKSIKVTRDEAMGHLADIMDKDVPIPGELHAAAATAAALAEKSRNADARASGLFGRKGPAAVKPINDAMIDKFAESLHEQMSEPELYGKLKSMDTEGQQRWLANAFDVANHPSVKTPEGAAKLYQAFYYNEALSGASTFGKSGGSHAVGVAMALATTGLDEVIGRVTGSEGRTMPGQTAIVAGTFAETIMSHWRGIAKMDIEGIKLLLEQEGDLHLIRPNPQTILDHIANLGAIPSIGLGLIRSPIKNALRVAGGAGEAFRRTAVEALSDEKLKDPDAFAERFEDLKANPDEQQIKFMNDYADQWSFTKSYTDALRGSLQAPGKLGMLNMLLFDPFVKIGTNMASLGVEYNPVFAGVRAAIPWGEMPLSKKLSIFALGSAVMMTGLALGQNDLIDPAGPSDPHEQAAWQAAGHYPLSVRINGKPAFSTKYLGPIGPLLTAGAQMGYVWDAWDDHQRQQAIGAMALALAQTATSQGILDTYAHIVSSLGDAQSALRYMKDRIESGALVFPGHIGLARDIEGILGPGGTKLTMTKVDPKDNLVAHTWDLIDQDFNWNLTGWAKDQPMVRDPLTGSAIPRTGLLGVKQRDDNPVAKMIDYLGSAQGGMKYSILSPRRTVGGAAHATGPMNDASAYAPIPLSAWEYDRKIQLAAETEVGGKTLMEALTEAIAEPEFKEHLAHEKSNAAARREGWCANRMKEIYQMYEQRGEDMLLAEDDHLAWEVEKKQFDAEQLQSLTPRTFEDEKPEPDKQKYPRPGQNTRK